MIKSILTFIFCGLTLTSLQAEDGSSYLDFGGFCSAFALDPSAVTSLTGATTTSISYNGTTYTALAFEKILRTLIYYRPHLLQANPAQVQLAAIIDAMWGTVEDGFITEIERSPADRQHENYVNNTLADKQPALQAANAQIKNFQTALDNINKGVADETAARVQAWNDKITAAQAEIEKLTAANPVDKDAIATENTIITQANRALKTITDDGGIDVGGPLAAASRKQINDLQGDIEKAQARASEYGGQIDGANAAAAQLPQSDPTEQIFSRLAELAPAADAATE